jgi:hypothetical protein
MTLDEYRHAMDDRRLGLVVGPAIYHVTMPSPPARRVALASARPLTPTRRPSADRLEADRAQRALDEAQLRLRLTRLGYCRPAPPAGWLPARLG